MLCRICVVQIQHRNHVLDHADYTAPTLQREPDPTDHTDQEYICPLKDLQIMNCKWQLVIHPMRACMFAFKPRFNLSCTTMFRPLCLFCASFHYSVGKKKKTNKSGQG